MANSFWNLWSVTFVFMLFKYNGISGGMSDCIFRFVEKRDCVFCVFCTEFHENHPAQLLGIIRLFCVKMPKKI